MVLAINSLDASAEEVAVARILIIIKISSLNICCSYNKHYTIFFNSLQVFFYNFYITQSRCFPPLRRRQNQMLIGQLLSTHYLLFILGSIFFTQLAFLFCLYIRICRKHWYCVGVCFLYTSCDIVLSYSGNNAGK